MFRHLNKPTKHPTEGQIMNIMTERIMTNPPLNLSKENKDNSKDFYQNYKEKFSKLDITPLLECYQNKIFSKFAKSKMAKVEAVFLCLKRNLETLNSFKQNGRFLNSTILRVFKKCLKTPYTTGLTTSDVKFTYRGETPDTTNLRHTQKLPPISPLEKYECSVLPLLENLYQNAPLGSLTIGYDTEYKTIEKGGKKYNKILLSQLWLYELGFGLVFVHKEGMRLNPTDLLELTLPPLKGVLDLGFQTREVKLHIKDNKRKKVRLTNLKVRFIHHFGAAEFSTWDKEFKEKYVEDFKVVRKSPVTMKDRKNHVEGLMLPVKLENWSNWNKAHIQISFSDSYLLFDNSLAGVGDMIGCEKITLREVDIKNFDTFLSANKNVALDYAINDAFVSVKAYYFMKGFIKDEIGVNSEVYTASGVGVKAFTTFLKRSEYKGVLEAITEPQNEDFINFNFLNLDNAGFYGGFNSVFKSGVYRGATFDYDLCGCYGMIKSSILLCDFAKAPKHIEINKGKVKRGLLNYDLMGYVILDFKLKRNKWNSLSPPIPVKHKNGLLFVYEADRAIIDIDTFLYAYDTGQFEGYYIHSIECYEPIRNKVKSMALADFVKEIITCRNGYKELMKEACNSFDKVRYDAFQKLYKLIINSLYGKFGQGVNTNTPHSTITNPCIAAKITARARIMLLSIINFLHSKGVTIFSATTDGFLSDQRIDRYLSQIEKLPMVDLVLDRYRKVMGDNSLPLLELKHFQNPDNDPINIILRTRTCFMYEKEKNGASKMYLAKGGIKVPIEIKRDHDLSFKFCMEVLESGGLNEQSNLTDAEDIYKNFKDLVNEQETKILNLEVDLKRKLQLRGFDNLNDIGINLTIPNFDTQPYQSLKEADNHLKAYESFRKTKVRQNMGKEFQPFKTKNFTLGGDKACYEFLFYIAVKSLYPKINNPINDLRVYIATKMKQDGLSNSEIETRLGFAKGKVRRVLDNYRRHEKDKIVYKLPIDLITNFEFYLHSFSDKLFQSMLDYVACIDNYFSSFTPPTLSTFQQLCLYFKHCLHSSKSVSPP
ncbi:DNA polymerase domain-containing protein [Helicobacter suis]|uniref:DNA polymerase domain-containing protein n=1 Tax=Helicobacter suis TaxID=104628 RepID=UPI0013D18246|nr:DNA polymerase domain-containing protein [Helicobacter suis]